MRNLLHRLRNSKFVRDTLFLQSATAVDLVVSVVTLIAMTRLLGREGFGSWAQVVRVHELLMLFLSVGVTQAALSRLPAAVAAGDKERVRELLAFFAKASILITGFAALAAAAVSPYVARYVYGVKDYEVIGWLAAVLLLSLPIGIPSRLVSTALQGSRRMEELAYYENFATLTRTSLVLLGLGFAVTLPSGDWRAVGCIVVARVLASTCNSVTAMFLYRRWRRRYREKARDDVDLPGIREILRLTPGAPLRQDLPFSLWIGLDKNVATLVTLVPFMILGHSTDESTQKSATALFHMAMRLLSFPLRALTAVSRNALVKLGEMRGAGDRDGFFAVLRQITLGSGGFSLILVGSLTAVAAWFVPLVFGADYAPCIPYLYVLAIYSAVQGFATGLGSVFNVYERIRTSLVIKLAAVVVVLPAGIHWSRTLEDPAMAVSIYHTVQMLTIVALAFLYVGGWLRRAPLPA